MTLSKDEARALEVHVLDAAYTRNPDATAADFKVGDLAVTWGHNKARVGVITKVGSKNITTLFTTPGAVTEAQKLQAMYAGRQVDPAAIRAEVLSNYRFCQEMAAGTHELAQPAKYRDHEKEIARAAERIAEFGDIEEYIALRIAKATVFLAEEKARTWESRVNFTVGRASFTQAGKLA